MVFCCLAKSKPTKKKILHIVIPHVAPKWYELGVELLSEEQESQLDVIKATNNNDVHKCSTEMFWFWLQSHPNASWYQLVECLKSPAVQLHALAADIEKLYAGIYILTSNAMNVLVIHYQLYNCTVSMSMYHSMHIKMCNVKNQHFLILVYRKAIRLVFPDTHICI